MKKSVIEKFYLVFVIMILVVGGMIPFVVGDGDFLNIDEEMLSKDDLLIIGIGEDATSTGNDFYNYVQEHPDFFNRHPHTGVVFVHPSEIPQLINRIENFQLNNLNEGLIVGYNNVLVLQHGLEGSKKCGHIICKKEGNSISVYNPNQIVNKLYSKRFIFDVCNAGQCFNPKDSFPGREIISSLVPVTDKILSVRSNWNLDEERLEIPIIIPGGSDFSSELFIVDAQSPMEAVINKLDDTVRFNLMGANRINDIADIFPFLEDIQKIIITFSSYFDMEDRRALSNIINKIILNDWEGAIRAVDDMKSELRNFREEKKTGFKPDCFFSQTKSPRQILQGR